MIGVILLFVSFFGFFGFRIKIIDDKIRNQLEKLKHIHHKTLYIKDDVNSETFLSGSRNRLYHFKKAKLVFTDDALLIFGGYKFGRYFIYKNLIILTKNINFYDSTFKSTITNYPKKMNLYSFHQDVYIDLEIVNYFLNTSVEIKLKGLTEIEKEYIHI